MGFKRFFIIKQKDYFIFYIQTILYILGGNNKLIDEEIEELKGEIKMNIPIKSKHILGFSSTLHNVSDGTIDIILQNLKKKINIIDSLK